MTRQQFVAGLIDAARKFEKDFARDFPELAEMPRPDWDEQFIAWYDMQEHDV